MVFNRVEGAFDCFLVDYCLLDSTGAMDFLQKGVVSSECLARSIRNAVEKENLARIFDRLYQVKAGGQSKHESGLGLGWSIARKIVELHQGEMWVNSELGEGSTLTV